jgi:uncharacterized protein (TIGR03435 family)
LKNNAWVVLLFCGAAYAQTFEVASIRPAAPLQMQDGGGMMVKVGSSGGPGTKDPIRATYRYQSLSALFIEAYDIRRNQLAGPAFLDTERFDINVKVPKGATKEEYKVMLQNLLTERFKVTLHHEKKETPVYELVVAKNGPKLKESKEEPKGEQPDVNPEGLPEVKLDVLKGGPGGPGPGAPFKRDKDGFPILPPGSTSNLMMNGRVMMGFSKGTMQDLATTLSGRLGKPVTDATGLKGKYDFTLSFAFAMEMQGMPSGGRGMVSGEPPLTPPPPGVDGAPPMPSAMSPGGGPTVFAAIQQQLGLKLEPKRGQVDVIVIDHIEKTPTEN